MNFGTTILIQSMETRQIYATQILIVLLLTLKPKILVISNDVEKCFGTSNYNENDITPLPIGKNKNELGGTIMKEVVALRPKAYEYLDDDGNDHKKAKGTKKCVIKQKVIFQN